MVGGGTRVSEVPKGGQQCCVTLVDDVVADVRTLSNGGGSIINGEDSHHLVSELTDDAADGRVPDCQISSTNVKVMMNVPLYGHCRHILLARDSMLSALYAIANPSVCLSVCPSVRHTGGLVENG